MRSRYDDGHMVVKTYLQVFVAATDAVLISFPRFNKVRKDIKIFLTRGCCEPLMESVCIEGLRTHGNYFRIML